MEKAIISPKKEIFLTNITINLVNSKPSVKKPNDTSLTKKRG